MPFLTEAMAKMRSVILGAVLSFETPLFAINSRIVANPELGWSPVTLRFPVINEERLAPISGLDSRRKLLHFAEFVPGLHRQL
jgi:hypothetical protein